MQTQNDENREIEKFTRLVNSAANREQFFEFILFCLERLDKGDTVQAIWRDYQASVGGT